MLLIDSFHFQPRWESFECAKKLSTPSGAQLRMQTCLRVLRIQEIRIFDFFHASFIRLNWLYMIYTCPLNNPPVLYIVGATPVAENLDGVSR